LLEDKRRISVPCADLSSDLLFVKTKTPPRLERTVEFQVRKLSNATFFALVCVSSPFVQVLRRNIVYLLVPQVRTLQWWKHEARDPERKNNNAFLSCLWFLQAVRQSTKASEMTLSSCSLQETNFWQFLNMSKHFEIS